MSKKKRRRFTAEQKAEVLRRLLFKKEKVADLAEEYGVQPSMIYRWQQAAEGQPCRDAGRREPCQSQGSSGTTAGGPDRVSQGPSSQEG